MLLILNVILLTGFNASAETPEMRVVFKDDFEAGVERWEILDPNTWRVAKRENNQTFEITDRSSDYKPPVRSPGHVALVKELELENVEIKFKVRSTKDTGNHRDCCIFFAYKDSQH